MELGGLFVGYSIVSCLGVIRSCLALGLLFLFVFICPSRVGVLWDLFCVLVCIFTDAVS